ncbi:MAG: efflux RND transporter permease subunit [Xanthomonadales bacterium]|nr:efflux RND transporter permease subunit [Gammaproteobacteria bacterium]NNK50081.1 efflux RND transporter permease subunit [Xanthomonadales bacterium]
MYKSLLTNHPLVNILFFVVFMMGLLSYMNMPREQDPEINFNWVIVRTILPGASAEDVEQLVTGPLEDAIRNVQDIRWVISTTRENASNILIRFRDLSEREFDKRINDIRREVQAKSNDELPDEAEDPFILEVTTSSGFPTGLVVVEGQADDETLRRLGRIVRDDLERLPGVDQVISIGLRDPELHVELEARELAARGLLATDVADSLGRAFRDTFAGKTSVSGNEWLVRVVGTTNDPEVLADFQIAPFNMPNSLISLNDVAEVKRGREEATQLVSFGGQAAIALSVTKIANTNTIDLIDRINEYIASKNAQLDGTGVQLVLADDQTIATRNAISIMQNNALLGLLLVLVVCWAFLGIRIAAMVTLGILFSIAGTLWVLNATGNTLNVSVLLGVVIVLGMLVDDAVVVVEAMYYRIQRGADGLAAAMDSLAEVARPVTSAVLTTMAAFLPLMLLPGIVGKFMFIIPFVVTVGLAVSLIEAFWILPSHVISLRANRDRRRLHEIHTPRTDRRTRWIHWIRVKYTKMLCYVMRRPVRFLAAGALAVLIAVSAVSMGLIRMEFFLADPIRLFYVNVDMPADAPIEETLRQGVLVEQEVLKLMRPSEVRAITVNAGIKFTETEALYGDQYAQVQVSLLPLESEGRTLDQIIADITEPIMATPVDGVISFTVLTGGPPSSRAISAKVRADDFDELRAATDAVKDIVSNIPGAINVTDNDVPGRAELVLDLDYKAVRRAGLTPGQVARLLRLHMDGEIVAFFRDQGEKVELRVRGMDRERQDIRSVLDDPIALPNGGITTFGALSNSGFQRGRGAISHYNYRRSITVEGDIDPNLTDTVTVNRVLAEEWAKIQARFPGADIDQSGELDDIQESLDAMLGLFLLGLGLIYLIIATQFRSYFQPLLILATIPMAFTGVVFGLLMTGNPLSLYTLYGVIALTGIAVNSAIVLIDAANARIKAGMRPLHATIYAARRRVIPILMTTITTIAGLFSLAVGLGGKSLVWGPVASSIVAGLGVASVLTLFMIPTLYRVFQRGHSGEEFLEKHGEKQVY